MSSSIPAAISALVSMWTAALPAIQVVDGPDYDARSSYLAVAYEDEQTPAVIAETQPDDVLRRSDRETYDVTCLLSMHNSSAEVSAVRADLFAALATAETALAANRTLGGAVASAGVTNYAYLPIRAESGSTASLRLTVHVLAWK